METDPRFKHRQATHRLPSGIQGNKTDQFALAQKFPKEVWGTNSLSHGDYLSFHGPLALNQAFGVLCTAHHAALSSPGSTPFCPLQQRRGLSGPGHPCTSPGSSWGLPSTFMLFHSSSPSYPIAPTSAFPAHSYPSSDPFELLSADFLAPLELDDSNVGPSAEQAPKTACVDF